MSHLKMKAPAGFSSMSIGGVEYPADNSGFVYVPGHHVARAEEHGCKQIASAKMVEPPAVEPQVGGTGKDADLRRAEANKAAAKRRKEERDADIARDEAIEAEVQTRLAAALAAKEAESKDKKPDGEIGAKANPDTAKK